MLPQIRLNRSSTAPLHMQLGDELRRLILTGELQPGSRLPSTRRAARELGISRTLVVLAYEQLQLEGYLRSAVGVGTWVPESLAPHLLAADAGGRSVVPRDGRESVALSARGMRLASGRSSITGSRPTLPFRPAAVAADLFPVKTWLRLTGRSWRARPSEMVHYGEVQGYRPLREALASHLARHRAVRVSADRIVLTAGSQQSLDMIARLLLDVGDRAMIENPGYDGAISALRAASAELVPIPVDDDGLDPTAVEAATGARLLYTTPSHQYPLGVTLSLERRLAVLGWAHRNGGWIVEDDYDSEFRYESRPLPSLQGLDAQDRVVYVGTFSKVLAPALRIGFIVLPEALIDPFVRARQVIDHHPPVSIQAPLAEFIAEGHLERHLARMRLVYAERRDALLGALDAAFGDRYPVVAGDGGLHVTMLLPDEVDDTAVSQLAFRRGIDPQPLSAHYVTPEVRRGLVLGFGGFAGEEIAVAVGTLRGCIEEVAGRKGR